MTTATAPKPTGNLKVEELTGEYSSTRWSSDDNSFLIGSLRDGTIVKGNADRSKLIPGGSYRFIGKWVNHPTYGKQFQFATFVESEPHTYHGVIQYLLRNTERVGIGRSHAHALVDAFGPDKVIGVIKRTPEAVPAVVPRVTLELAKKAAQQLKAVERFEQTKIDLLDLFAGRGFPGDLIDQCVRKFGVLGPRRLRHDPFTLLISEMPGCGFLRVDSLYQALGLPPDRLKRQAVCVWHVMKSDMSGSVWFRRGWIESKVREIVSGELKIDKAITLAVRARMVEVKVVDGVEWMATAEEAKNERRVAEYLRKIIAAKGSKDSVQWPSVEGIPESDTITVHQRRELLNATQGPAGLLTGLPGTGKSFSLARLVSLLPPDRVALAAPTGRAAIRIMESLAEYGHDLHASTIHSLLQITRNGHDGNGWGFLHNEHNPLPVDFVIIDECFPAGTMVDTPSGPVPIESLSPGDSILNASGTDTVVATKQTEIHDAAIIDAGGKKICSSAGHRFFTGRGWVRADELRPGDLVAQTESCVRNLRDGFHAKDEYTAAKVLYPGVCVQVPTSGSGVRQGQESLALVGRPEGKIRDGKNSNAQPDFSPVGSREDLAFIEGDWSRSVNSWRERQGDDCSSENAVGTLASHRMGSGDADPTRWTTARLSNELQGGFGELGLEDRHRGRRAQSLRDGEKIAGHEEGSKIEFTRVDGVAVFQQADSRLDQFRDADGKLRFYDIQAARHPSFSVEGLLVHNCSMIPNSLMASLLAAVRPGACVLFIGDPNQLPPVGAGRPFLDMIEAGLPHGHLGEVHRFAGRIAQVCKAINDGKPWQPSEQVDLEPVNGFPENLRHIERFNPAQQIEALKTVIDRVVNKRGFDAIWDMQVLCAVNDKSPVCRTKLNEVLQELLNPNGERLERNPFRVGDKVMVLRNGFRTEHWFEEKPSIAMEHYLANGEIGRVDHISEHWIAAWFGGCGQMIRFDRNEWTDVTLAYACTVHKAQGAGFPVVIVMIDGSGGAGFVCSRSHHYTAISRSAKLCVTIGKKSVMADHCKRVDTERRKTFLTEAIKEWMSP